MKFDDVQPGDLLTPTKEILEKGQGYQDFPMWKSAEDYDWAEQEFPASLVGGRHEAYGLHYGEVIMVTKVALNKTTRSYVEAYSLKHRQAVWFPLGCWEYLLKRVAKAPRSAKVKK